MYPDMVKNFFPFLRRVQLFSSEFDLSKWKVRVRGQKDVGWYSPMDLALRMV
jgi:hypothetical protein